MTALREPFDVVHKKTIRGIDLDYVSWAQVADRLDEAAPGWSFAIVQVGEDWCWGRLTIDGRTFENIGYAENAEADWKKEALKDAVSDALKRCAALAGVARYLYDKTSQNGARPPVAARGAVQTEKVTIGATPRPQAVPDLDDEAWSILSGKAQEVFAEPATDGCPIHNKPWKTVPAGTSKKTGKPYAAFDACPEFGCNEKPR